MTLADFEPLTEAEEAVIAGLGTGHVTVLGDGTLPDPKAGEDRRVRASLIRWLALGAPGDDAVRLREPGLEIMGALVGSNGQADSVLGVVLTQVLDLEGCRLEHNIMLLNCRFLGTPVLRGAEVQSVIFNRSQLPGVNADRLEARGSVFLRGVQTQGEVRLLGARIGGNLDCEGGRFENAGGDALNASGARVTGAFFWRDASHAKGALDLTSAEIGDICDDPACWPEPGDLLLNRCRYGAFTGQGVTADDRIRWLDLQNPAKYGDEFWPQPWEHCAQVLREMGHADDARAVLIAKEERQRRVRREIELARLAGARLRKRLDAAFDDETVQACATEVEAYRSALTHEADPRGQAFLGQFRNATGFQVGQWRKKVADYDALMARVAAKADRIGTRGADAALAAQSAVTEAWCKMAFLRLCDWFLGALIAYGHRPLRALGWLAGMWLFGAVLFGVVHGNGGFKPNSAFILSKPEWFECAAGGARRGDHPSTLACYRAQPAAAGYPAFNAALYSLDTLVPVVDLEVQDYWVPDERVSPAARYYLWFHIGMGWFLALLAVAGVSGLIDTRATKE